MAYNVLTGSIFRIPTGSIEITGSFAGDGSNLNNLPVDTISNPADNRLITFTSTSGQTLNGETNLTFNGSALGITGEVTASIGIKASFFEGDGSRLTGVGGGGTGGGIFTEINTSTAYTTSSVSIGGSHTPTYALDVAGDAGFNEYIYHNGDTDTFLRFEPDKINIEAGGENMIYIVQGSGGDQADKVTINNDSQDVDFQVKGLTKADLIRADVANDRVGIGVRNPDASLHVSGTTHLSGGVSFRRVAVTANHTASTAEFFLGVDTSAAISILLDATQFTNGQMIVVKDEIGSASTNNITLTASGSQTIDADYASVAIESPFGAVNLYSNTTNWFIF